MFKLISTVPFILAAGLATACGGSDPTGRGGDFIDHPEGFPFVVVAVAVSDLCPGNAAESCALARNPPRGATQVFLTQPESGKICMQGSIGKGGWAFTVLSFTEYSDTGVVSTFNAEKLGITQVSFTLETPPARGLSLMASVIKQYSCEPPGAACRLGGFYFTDSYSKDVVPFTHTQKVVAPFANFVQQYPETGSKTFDTTVLDGVYFESGDAGPIDFCVSDFEFLDKDGKVVEPPATPAS